MTRSVTLPPAVEVWAAPEPLALASGAALDEWHLGFEIQGEARAPVILVQGGISAGAHVSAHEANPAPGWWDALVGADRAIDTARYRVLGIDYLGGAGASSGPVSGNAARGLGFPAVTALDQARATAALLDRLGIERLHAIAGGSYGGMVGLAFALLFPRRVGATIAIGAAHRSHPLATAWRSVERRVVRLGIERGCAREALVLARALAMCTYRSEDDFALRFDAPPRWSSGGTPRFAVEEYITRRGESFADRFTPEAFYILSQAIDLHRIEPHDIRAPVTAIGLSSDRLVPPALVEELVAGCGAPARCHRLDSRYGHDAFLKEHERLATLIRGALEEIPS